jgi:hypothetical protein
MALALLPVPKKNGVVRIATFLKKQNLRKPKISEKNNCCGGHCFYPGSFSKTTIEQR